MYKSVFCINFNILLYDFFALGKNEYQDEKLREIDYYSRVWKNNDFAIDSDVDELKIMKNPEKFKKKS